MAASERSTLVRAKEIAKTDQSPATDLDSREEVAVKLEYHKIDPSLLRDEFDFYDSTCWGGKRIPKVYWCG
ncbi:hypothetical protein GJ744_012198 [Endocarpon pusillum]|uniref:Uncharacterized protein n=1 Tax=Endocarpon pusillum TaxID=364733 RepID=A0A8H7AET9_9EURO|nr:hypothetical protein GJ744_012198 [Endocarpon pusillum]